MGLRSRIIIVVVLACTIINLFLCFYFISQLKNQELQSLQTRVDKAARMMKLVNARPLYNVDKETLRVNMETFFEDENMKSISINEVDIEIDIHLERTLIPGGVDIEKQFDISYKGLKLGVMTVVYSTALIERKMERFLRQMLYFTFAVILLMVMGLTFTINRLVRPVSKLAVAASEIAAGNLEKEIDQDGVGEVGVLSRNFATMRDAIKDKINDLARTNQNLEREIVQKERNEKRILRQRTVISSVNAFFQQSMMAQSYTEAAELFLPIARAVIPSTCCFVAEKDKEAASSVRMLASAHAGDADVPQGNGPERLMTGVLAQIMAQNKTVIANDPELLADFVEPAADCRPMENFLGVPIQMGSEIRGGVAFVNKPGGFDAGDEEAAKMLAVALMEALRLKHQEEERQRLEEMMVQSEKMVSLGGLAAGMAHEINNPLAGILQNAQVIRNRLKNDLPGNIQAAGELGLDLDLMAAYLEKRGVFRMIESLMTAGKRAAAIVANMLSFSRKSASGFIPEDLARLLDQTVELAESDYNLKKRFDFKRIRIDRDYMADLPKVSCKASELQQVFFNILSNGAQAMMSQKEEMEPCFSFKLYMEGNWVCVQIKDNGPGMPSDVRKRIFDPFFTTKNVGEGTGLGLAVSYFIVTENHKGRIEVDSTPGEGSCFTIKLPV